MPHPARYSQSILDVVGELLVARWPDFMGRPILHDPFAGTGERLHELANRIGFGYSGTEIEAPYIAAPGIIHGDARDPYTYPPGRFPAETDTGGWVVLTSPVYANGIADNHKPRDASKRYTYRASLIDMTGTDYQLDPNNMAGYGYRGTSRDSRSSKRSEFWRIADEAMACWDSALAVYLNVSDFISGGVVEPHVDDWKALLAKHGWTDQQDVEVDTPRMGNGDNREVRVDHEVVIVAGRP